MSHGYQLLGTSLSPTQFGSYFAQKSRATKVAAIAVAAVLLILVLLQIPHGYVTNLSSKGSDFPSRSKVLLMLPKDTNNAANYGFDDWHEKTIANRREYAAYHGFGFEWIDISKFVPEVASQSDDKGSRHSLQWAKVFAIHEAFDNHPEAEWIWVLDSDVIIMNATINVWDEVVSPAALAREVIPGSEIRFAGRTKNKASQDKRVKTPNIVDAQDIYLVIATDENCLNAGSIFIKRNSFMSAFVDLWHEPYLMNNNFSFNEQDGLAHLLINHPHVLKHVGIVSPKKINANRFNYKKGDLLVHFAGCRDGGDMPQCNKLFQEFWNSRTSVAAEVEPARR